MILFSIAQRHDIIPLNFWFQIFLGSQTLAFGLPFFLPLFSEKFQEEWLLFWVQTLSTKDWMVCFEEIVSEKSEWSKEVES